MSDDEIARKMRQAMAEMTPEEIKRVRGALEDAHEFSKKLAKLVSKAGKKRDLSPAQITCALCELFIAAAKSSRCPETSLLGMFCKYASEYYPDVAFKMQEQSGPDLNVMVAGKEFTETVH